MPENSTLPAAADDEFRAFLDEVERLSIRREDDGAAADGATAAGVEATKQQRPRGGDDATNRSISVRTTDRKGMVARADESRRAWSEFQRLDLPRRGGGVEDDAPKPKISFRIKGANEKKTKRKKKKKGVATAREDRGDREEAGGKGSRPSPEIHEPATSSGVVDEPSFRTPRWTLVVDTCSLLRDRGRDAHNVLALVGPAAGTANGAAANDAALAALAADADEPVDVVIPFKVWAELEHRSKSSEPGDAYAARTAVRALRSALESDDATTGRARLGMGGGGHGGGGVLRSQSLSEARDAADRFLPPGDGRGATNDDHILACAVAERDASTKRGGAGVAAGGVVLLTLDNNLACKGHANGLRVFSPSEFRRHYDERMASLRLRARRRLVDSALRR